MLDPDDVSAAPGRTRYVNAAGWPATRHRETRTGGHRPRTGVELDITKLLGPHKWTWYYLYVILDVYSRYAVGWAVAARETAASPKHSSPNASTSKASAADQLTPVPGSGAGP